VAAPLALIPNGREQLNTLHTYTKVNPFFQLPGLYFAGDYAFQWNNRIDMTSNAYSGEVGHVMTQSPLMPKISYGFRSFQGDDPATAKFEKFDPLFYEGAPNLWASGSNGSFSFLNSNIQAHRIAASINWTPTDIDPIQPARAVDFTQVKTPDRGLGCNRLFVDCNRCRVFVAT
jgi:hypothetical protein